MNVTDVLKYGHLTVCHTVEGLPDAQWEIGGVCGVWSVKDIIGHLASFEHLLTDILSTFLDGGETPYLTQLNKLGGQRFNDIQTEARKTKSVQEVWREYNDAYSESTALVHRIPAELWTQVGSLPWYGAEYALDDFIVYSFYGHKREHTAQINVYRDTLKTG